MAIRPTQPQRVDSVLDTAVKLSKASVVKVLPLSLLMALVSMPGSIYLFVKGGVDLSGLAALTRVVDLGTSAGDAPDAISFTFIGLAVQCTAQPNLPLFAMTGGQVTVN